MKFEISNVEHMIENAFLKCQKMEHAPVFPFGGHVHKRTTVNTSCGSSATVGSDHNTTMTVKTFVTARVRVCTRSYRATLSSDKHIQCCGFWKLKPQRQTRSHHCRKIPAVSTGAQKRTDRNISATQYIFRPMRPGRRMQQNTGLVG